MITEQQDIAIIGADRPHELDIWWQEAVVVDVAATLTYVKSGEAEINAYVETQAKPEIRRFIQTYAEPIVDKVVSENSAAIIDAYVNGTAKPELADYVSSVIEPNISSFAAAEMQDYKDAAATSAATAQTNAASANLSATSAANSASSATTAAATASAQAEAAANSANAAQSSANAAASSAQATAALIPSPAGQVGRFLQSDGSGTAWADIGIRVVSTYVNGTDWYRIWSDGWIEQGGRVIATERTTVVNVLYPFSNTNFWCLCNYQSNTADTGAARTNYVLAEPLNNTQIICGSYNSSGKVRWYACGY